MFYITYVLEISAFLTGLIFLQRVRPVIYRTVIIVLLLSVVNEGLAHYKIYQQWNVSKHIFYNSFFLIELAIFSLIFYKALQDRAYQKKILTVAVAGMIAVVVAIVTNGFVPFNPFLIDAVIISIIFQAGLYLYLRNAGQKVYDLTADPLFWFSSGVILVNVFLLLAVNAIFIDAFKADSMSKSIISTLNTIGNLVYYAFIIISMLCSFRSPRLAGT
ncbi:MAG: hypothetical protein ABW007_14810 [Chitinophagaceae bacterium]